MRTPMQSSRLRSGHIGARPYLCDVVYESTSKGNYSDPR